MIRLTDVSESSIKYRDRAVLVHVKQNRRIIIRINSYAFRSINVWRLCMLTIQKMRDLAPEINQKYPGYLKKDMQMKGKSFHQMHSEIGGEVMLSLCRGLYLLDVLN